MNRSDDGSNFDDTLGQMIRWSLRSDSVCSAPPPAVWPRIRSGVQAWDHDPAARHPARRLAAAGIAAGHGIGRAGGMLLAALASLAGPCVQVWRYVDERTLSSEAVWQADTHTAPRNMLALRYRLTVQIVSAGPLLGQRLPII